ncbi:hypothetical protein [Tengunoibacter tsumagoiensis]|uniref:Uncharacterized protein n=1 Tax=Tengunoibacter tsumagoiensis TaxID=2014871 RepID=A0A402A2R2_9CHLR|nr:hypothetical protein [Tengunoibacter tsumagoiensis]GCE13345.1 hypothetical protein KTT_32040 [Tengunoibacter tsumagoiensis]
MSIQPLTIKQLWLLALAICLGLLIVILILEMAIDQPIVLADLLPTRPFELIILLLSLLTLFVGIVILCGEKVMERFFHMGSFCAAASDGRYTRSGVSTGEGCMGCVGVNKYVRLM